MKKRILSTLLILMALMVLLPTAALATEGETNDPAASEEVLPGDGGSVVEETAVQLSAPTDLAWGSYYIDTEKLFDYEGMMSWKVTQTDVDHEYLVHVYRKGEDGNADEEVFSNAWIYRAGSGEWMCDHDFVNNFDEDTPDGTYYFTVQPVTEDAEYLSGEVVTSGTWTFTNPQAAVEQVTGLSWDWPTARWDAAEDENAYGYTVKIYYSADNADATSTAGMKRVGGFVWWFGEGRTEHEFTLSDSQIAKYGEGYYYFVVKAVSSNVNVAMHSDFTAPSAAWHYTGAAEETGYTLTYEYDEDLCSFTVTDEETELEVSSGGTLPEDHRAIFEITDIADGYRIKAVRFNETDETEGFVNGGYGMLAAYIDEDTNIEIELEEIPDTLPSVTSVTLYTNQAGTDLAPENITYTEDDTSARLYGIAAYNDGKEYPVYYATGRWEYSTDGVTWYLAECWGDNRFDFWPGWKYHEELDFLSDSYDIRLKVEPKDLYTTGEAVNSNVLHINGGAAANVPEEEPPRLSAPTDLTWGGYYSRTEKLFDYEGMMAWKVTQTDVDHEYLVHVYRKGEDGNADEEVFSNAWIYRANKGEWMCDHDFVNNFDEDMPSGDYYFTVQAFSDDEEEYRDSEAVASGIWSFTNPQTTVEQATGLKWNWPVAEWDASEDENAYGYTFGLYYSETDANAQSTDELDRLDGYVWWFGEGDTSTSFEIDEAEYVGEYGEGYYYFTVETVSANVNTAMHSGQTLSSAYHYTTEPPVEPPAPDPGPDPDDPSGDEVPTGGTWGSNLTWTLTDGVLTVEGEGAMEDGCLFSNDAHKAAVKEIVIGEGVTSVGESAFEGFSNVETVTLPEGFGLTAIGKRAFYGCSGLKEINIPATVSTIGSYAFYQCTSLTEAEIPAGVTSISPFAFSRCTALEHVTLFPMLLSIDEGAFSGCTALEEIVIPDTVSTIDQNAFANCKALQHVTVGRDVRKILDNAFLNCSALDEIIFRCQDAPKADDTAFDGVSAVCYYPLGGDGWDELEDEFGDLKWLSLAGGTCGENLSWILQGGSLTISGTGAMTDFFSGDSVFERYADYIEEIFIEEGVTSVGNHAFEELEKLRRAVLPKSITSIGDWAFSECIRLDNVTLPETLTQLGAGAFFDCDRLVSVAIPEGITALPDHLFEACEYLTEVELPDGLKEIGAGAFSECIRLTAIQIPDSVKYIGEMAFADCAALEYIELPDSLNRINEACFQRCVSLREIVIPESMEIIGAEAFYGCSSLREIALPEDLFELGAEAFADCENLTHVSIPAGELRELPESVFEDCVRLVSVDLGKSIFLIDTYAFRNCKSLVSIVIPHGVKTIEDRAFNSCSNLENVILPETLRSIGANAFAHCSGLASIALPGRLEFLDYDAFKNCVALKDVYYQNSEEEWYELVPKTLNIFNEDTVVHFNALMLTAQPEDAAVAENVTALFQVEVREEEDEVLEYQWYFNTGKSDVWYKATAAGNKTDTLSVPGTAWRSGYQYRCRITGENGGEVWSNPAKLTVHPIRIVADPQDVTAMPDREAKFTVIASGSDLTYQWQKRANAEEEWADLTDKDSTGTTITVTTNFSCDGWQYRCAVTDSSGRTVYTGAAILSVVPFQIIEHPSSISCDPGQTAEFTVGVRGEGFSYQWQYRASSTGRWRSATAEGNRSHTLSVPATTSRNGYEYRCEITDSATGYVGCSGIATLSVQVKTLEIKKQPVSVTADEDNTVYFSVSAAGQNIKYQWQYKAAENAIWRAATASGNRSNYLTVPASAWRDGYQYRCEITDESGGRIYSDVVTLDVRIELEITSQPTSVEAELGENVKFTVSARGSGLTYQWKYKTRNGTAWANATAAGNKTATLTLSATESRNGNQYRCLVTDESGNTLYSSAATLSVALTGVTIQNQPEDVKVNAGETAKFTVKATGSGLTYQWQFKAPTNANWGKATAAGNQTATLSVPATANRNGYQYRCVITDANGNAVTSDAALLSVVTFAITAHPEDVTASAADAVSFSVKATGSGLTYQWQFKAKPTAASWSNNTCTADTLSFDPVGAWRNGYQYRCMVTDANGSVLYSDTASLVVK